MDNLITDSESISKTLNFKLTKEDIEHIFDNDILHLLPRYAYHKMVLYIRIYANLFDDFENFHYTDLRFGRNYIHDKKISISVDIAEKSLLWKDMNEDKFTADIYDLIYEASVDKITKHSHSEGITEFNLNLSVLFDLVIQPVSKIILWNIYDALAFLFKSFISWSYDSSHILQLNYFKLGFKFTGSLIKQEISRNDLYNLLSTIKFAPRQTIYDDTDEYIFALLDRYNASIAVSSLTLKMYRAYDKLLDRTLLKIIIEILISITSPPDGNEVKTDYKDEVAILFISNFMNDLTLKINIKGAKNELTILT